MFLTIITFIIILSVLVLVHEGGHFWAAKKAGIKVEEFGFGYPPKILSKKIKGTIYSINAIPFGGFVRLYGEEGPASAKATVGKDAFTSKSKRARTGVILAGVFANFILAIFCFAIVYSVSGIPTKTNQIKIIGVASDSPAITAGLKEDDVILAVNESSINQLPQFTTLIKEKAGQSIRLTIGRENGNLILSVIPRANPPENEGPLGVAVTDMEMKKYPLWQMPFRGAVEGLKEAIGWGWLIFNSLVMMLVNLVGKGIVPKDVAGPIGFFQATSVVAKNGLLSLIQFLGVISVNLAILNVMPIPALDGGRLIFIIYELIARRKPKANVERIINTAGMAIIVLLIILVTVNDLSRLHLKLPF